MRKHCLFEMNKLKRGKIMEAYDVIRILACIVAGYFLADKLGTFKN